MAAAHRKWATGIYMLWYPIKDRAEPDALAKRLRRLAFAKMLRAELTVAPLSDPTRLNGCGLILVNPPWTLDGELAILLPALAKILGRAPAKAASGSTGWPAKRPPAPVTIGPLSSGTQLVSSSISGSDVPPPGGGPAE